MKRIFIFILAILLIISYDFVKTNALFESKVTVPVNSSLASWEISVNDSLVGTNKNFIIDNIVWNESNVVAEGKAAPGRTGYFIINIKPNDTKVAYRYDIEINNNSTFEILSVESISGTTLVRTDINTYSSIVTLNDIDNDVESKIRVNVAWNNHEYNNEVDTKLSDDRATISIPVSMHFIQYDGEELVNYVE